jgi:hypothetical protein
MGWILEKQAFAIWAKSKAKTGQLVSVVGNLIRENPYMQEQPLKDLSFPLFGAFFLQYFKSIAKFLKFFSDCPKTTPTGPNGFVVRKPP